MVRVVGIVAALALAVPAWCATRVLVTAVERRTGAPVLGLGAGDFSVLAGRSARAVESCEYKTGPVDVMLLIDASAIGEAASGLAPSLVGQLGGKEQMAIVAFHSAADLVQDFTSSKDLLLRALGEIKYGNAPRMLDAVYAAASEGFESATYRRAILLLTSGVDAPGQTSEKEVVRVCRRNGVSVYPVYLMGYGRSLAEKLAERTAGAAFSLRDLAREAGVPPAVRVFEVMRGQYTLMLAGNLALGDDVRIEVAGKKGLRVSFLELD
jgi:hypothetical protein